MKKKLNRTIKLVMVLAFSVMLALTDFPSDHMGGLRNFLGYADRVKAQAMMHLYIVTPGGMVDILTLAPNKSGARVVNGSSGTAEYYESEGYLKLSSYVVDSEYYHTYEYHPEGVSSSIIYYHDCSIFCDGDLTIKVYGTNSIVSHGLTSHNCDGIYVDGNLTIEDYGIKQPNTLDIKKSETVFSENTAGINCAGKLTIRQNNANGYSLHVYAEGSDLTGKGQKGSRGISCCGLEIDGKSGKTLVKATSGDCTYTGGKQSTYGISSSDDITVKNCAVNAEALTGGTDSGSSCGIYQSKAGSKITIDNSTVTADADANAHTSYGLWTCGSLELANGASLTAKTAKTGSAASDDRRLTYGVLANNDVNIKDRSTLNCEGCGKLGGSFGIEIKDGDMSVKDSSKINAKSGKASTYQSCAIRIDIGGMDSTNSTIVAASEGCSGANTNGGVNSGIYIGSGNAVISAGSVNASCGEARHHGSYGLYVIGDITTGDNAVVSGTAGTSNNKQPSIGVYATGKIKMTGGTLTGIGGTLKFDDISCGIYAYKEGIDISGGTMTGRGGIPMGGTTSEPLGTSYGIWTADNALKMSGDAKVIAEGGSVSGTNSSYNQKATSLGVFTGNLSCGDSATLTAKGGNVRHGTSAGVYISKEASITGGSISATGGEIYCDDWGKADHVSYGFWMNSGTSLSMSGGSITGTGGKAPFEGEYLCESYGIDLGIRGDKGSLSLTGGQISGIAGNAERSCGIKAYNRDIVLTSGSACITAWGNTNAIKNHSDSDKVIANRIVGGASALDPKEENAFDPEWKYVELYAKAPSLEMKGWTYGDSPKEPVVTDGTVTTVEYMTGGEYTTEVPSDAGIYTVRVTLDSGEKLEKAFVIEPRSLSDEAISFSFAGDPTNEYTGYRHGPAFTLEYKGAILDPDRDYDITGGSQAQNVEDTTVTMTGKGNFKGVRNDIWRWEKATPKAGDFNIPAVPGDISYTGDPVELELPALKSPRSGCGDIVLKYNGEASLPVHTGSYAVTFDVAGGQNYKSAGGFEYGTLNIGKADGDPAYIISKVSTVKNGSVELKNYVTGAAGEVSFSVKTALAGCSLDQDTGILTTGDTTGDCVVTVTMGESADYKGKTAEITVSVTNKLMQNMSFAIPENGKVYGDEDFSATVEGASTEVNYAVAEGNDVVSIDSDTGLVHIIKAGSATITATAAESDEYVAAVRSLKLEIGRKSVTVKAEDKSKNMGEDDPELTAVVSGLVAGESETLINYSLSREGGEAGGEYAITAVGNTIQGNYTVNYVAGTLTIIDNTVYPAVMTSAPEAVGNLCADGSARALVSPGSAEGGTIMYALGIDDHTIPAADKFSGSVPTGTEAGTYYVWYKIIGDESHLDTEAKCITVVIKEAEPEPEPEQPVHMHTLVHHVRVEATVEAEGSIEYWECTECKKLYADEEATKEISAEDIVIPKLKPETETAAPAAPVTVTEIIGEVPVTINMDVVYPKAVTWTGKRITKDQLAVLAENGELAKVDISGLAEAVKTLKPGTDISKLYKLSYLISRDKDVSKGKAYFTMKLTLKGSAVKKAGIKGNDRKALQQLIKRFNEQLKEKKYYYDIVPINLKDAESVSIKAKPVAGQLQVNEDGTLKGLKSLKIKVKIKGVKKIKTYSFSAKKAAKTFDMRVSDPAAGTVTIIAKNGTGFAGSRAATEVKK